MGDIEDYDFSTGDAGSSHVFNMEAGQIRKGGFIVIKGHPCKVNDVSTSKTGKHGHAKCNFVAIDIFTNKKYEDIIPSTHNAHVPVVTRKEYSLLSIDGEGFCSLLDEETSETREDIKLPDVPDNFGREIREDYEAGKNLVVTVLSAMGHEQIVAKKEENQPSS
mmetsp:Transcript_1745/g.1753  ORF Transcript_1745/g.1753 Transcript_1745/m.1753 type:complete len:164 (-) Transcript_1745:80-571(-)|eukprot:CAMPEP_0174819968 /NCGR_PEP_ID=MMETSP1107-20130205/3494_1 /TAXON_ID=36770 /ORGANISM="Paraphysomonas vestita, Strain GFlagA" /LENGTH=163 /DNA_ID=CAMNT_0016034415 /DNA_START=45 /DNA_END=536 /DNA_ORIENTATION=-